MGPTYEVLRQIVGRQAQLGFVTHDYKNHSGKEHVLYNQIKILDKDAKKHRTEKLLAKG